MRTATTAAPSYSATHSLSWRGPVPELQNISLARGAPSLDIIAVDELRAAADRAFRRDPAGAFSYGTSAGYPRLIDWIATKYGLDPDQVVATNGSMQADAFLFQPLVEPGDVVVVEAPTYDRTLLALRKLGAEILAIPLEPDGIDVEGLERALAAGARPKLAHIIPNFQNPAGCTLSLEKRRGLLELAERYDFVVFEDDPYVELRFEGHPHPTMLSLDGTRKVVYASSFSKTVCPGIRVGYLAGPADLIADVRRLGTETYISPTPTPSWPAPKVARREASTGAGPAPDPKRRRAVLGRLRHLPEPPRDLSRDLGGDRRPGAVRGLGARPQGAHRQLRQLAPDRGARDPVARQLPRDRPADHRRLRVRADRPRSG